MSAKTVKKTNNYTARKPEAFVRPKKTEQADVALPDDVTLPEKYGFLREAKTALDAMSPRITGLAVQIELLQLQQAQAVKEFVGLDQQLRESIHKAAAENGVVLDGQNWNFNIPTLTFSRAS